ncbi:hypothetical protein F4780DRAFT_214136 [Xylariomycetidae sp. FL0641]|nr:hypothetical protein F4780DRAFT_214136 [Xylariomycetidae sp. FL0641]
MSTPHELGPLVRLWGIRTQQLPSPSEGAEELAPFLISILSEAVPFVDSASPKSLSSADAKNDKLWKPKGTKTSPDSTAPVEVSERVVPAKDLAPFAAQGNKTKPASEYWCCRRSVHEDAPRKGTASWAEFERCFRVEHAASEKAFTPAVVKTNTALAWDCGGVEAREAGRLWGDFRLVVEEMRHKVGRPVLKDRTFPVLQMSCKALDTQDGPEEFLVVSIPVPDFADAEASALAKEKGAQVAFYVSVERFRKLPDGKIEWVMATASNAAGVLPMFVQNLAMPGVIWKDVPLFLAWIAKQRSGGEAPQVTTGVATGQTVKVSVGAEEGTASTTEAPQITTDVATGTRTEESRAGD